jgi:hypothetical protein
MSDANVFNSGLDKLISSAEYRAALGSINYNAYNYQILTVAIGLGLLFSLSSFAGTFIAVQAEDQNMSENVLYGIIILDGIAVAIVFLCYLAYLRNVGQYIYSRFKPMFTSENKVKCVE